MLYGICNLSIIPLRKEPRDASELISQVLYGESFKILESNSKWSFIELAFDQYRGWIDNKQFQWIDLKVFEKLNASQSQYSKNLVEYIEQDQLKRERNSRKYSYNEVELVDQCMYGY